MHKHSKREKLHKVGTQNDTIELNGYHYDARTGQQLGRAGSNGAPQRPRSVDGFMRPKQNSTPTRPISQKTPTPSHTLHSKTSKSQTLRRQGLKKPETPNPVPLQTQPIAKRSIKPNPERENRAATALKHPNVSKFQSQVSTQPMKVKQAPQDQAKKQYEEVKKTVLPLSSYDMALKEADSHLQKSPQRTPLKQRISRKLKVSPKTFSAALGVFLVVALGGYFAKQHVSTLAVQLAAQRSGVEARLPGYEPAGFSLAGPIEYSAGQIAMSYQSNSDDRNFRIVQKNSDWNSQALLENFIEASDQQFQTVQDKGKTIFIYNGNNATWVSGGVWFQVEGESSLNTDQLLRIASGL